MNPKHVEEAAEEARRFLKRVAELKKKTRREDWANTDYLWGSKYTAAVRRASLDLTRAVAKMRMSPSEEAKAEQRDQGGE